jgi:hypothetical protein
MIAGYATISFEKSKFRLGVFTWPPLFSLFLSDSIKRVKVLTLSAG